MNISRRQFLYGSVASMSALTVAACGPAPERSEVIIRTGGWPVTTMPTAEAIAEDPSRQIYADALQTWLNRNSHVRLERIETNIWDPQAMLTAVAGDTAPTYFLSTVLGNWSATQARAAFAQGLMADLSSAIPNTALSSNLLPNYRSAYEKTGQVDGKYFYFPIDAAMDDVIWYRRDLAAQAGVLPNENWDWDAFYRMIEAMSNDSIHGLGAPFYFVGRILRAHGFELLSEVPMPERAWPWMRDFSDARWTELASTYRDYVFNRDVVFSDAAFTSDREYRDAFRAGSVGTVSTNILSAFAAPHTDTSIAALARELGQSFEETIGFAPIPRGDGLSLGGVNFGGGVSLPPNSSPETIEAAIDLVDYIFYGEVADEMTRAVFEQTGDLQQIYTNPIPLNGRYQIPGVSGSFADAWGERILAEIQTVAALPNAPSRQRIAFFPPEENVLPDNQVIDDLWSRLTYDSEANDVAAEFEATAATWNQQTEFFESSVGKETFAEGSANYFEAVGESLKASSPDFYTERFVPFFEGKVRPNLS